MIGEKDPTRSKKEDVSLTTSVKKAKTEESASGKSTKPATPSSSSSSKSRSSSKDERDELMSLLSTQSAKEKEDKKQREEILQLLSQPTAKEMSLMDTFRSATGSGVREFCHHSTKRECMRANSSRRHCEKLHFKKILQPHTDENLGDCSFLNTCFHMDNCNYKHKEVDADDIRYTSIVQLPLRIVTEKNVLKADVGDGLRGGVRSGRGQCLRQQAPPAPN